MKLLIVVITLIGTLYFLVKYLINQSKKPKGIIGKLMMKTWNTAYFPMVKWALNNIPIQSNLTILDIGISNGLSSEYLFDHFPRAKLKGIDISEEAIKQTKKRFKDKSANFSVQTIESTEFLAEKFDLICAFQTHFHWGKLAEAFREIE
ncbi:class I SAM-dependent methyltransferase, partial [Enterococcus sp. AZ109]|uniref:class I SAM-dependent methyltransferase n=1 Tax=Enterococcus sp. AZ109 TaxID=2774634 RepID=UPI003F684FB3